MTLCRTTDMVLLLIAVSVLTMWQLYQHAQSSSSVYELRVLNQTVASLERRFYSTLLSLRNKTSSNLRYPHSTIDPLLPLNKTHSHIPPPSLIQSQGAVETFRDSTLPRQRRALIFTMDSLTAVEQESLRGGASGEITIRRSLEETLTRINVRVDTMHSDAEFNAKTSLSDYDYVILDPWTWAGPGWRPKNNLIGIPPSRIFILDFFGHPNRREMEGRLNVPYKNFLTAFGSPWKNTFLGYFISENILADPTPKKVNQGVIWGKDHKHLSSHQSLLRHLADHVRLVATTTPLFQHPQITWLGHVDKSKWMELLAESKFLIGLGDPLLGPSAMDAIAAGCVFINPVYKDLKLGGYPSQHPFAQRTSGERVCSYPVGDSTKALQCVKTALEASFERYIPPELTVEAYTKRVRNIFDIK